MKKIYMIAGEPSGDLHGAHLAEALKKEDPKLELRGFGGPKMVKAGVKLDQTIDRLSFMGFSEVLVHLPVIFSNFRIAKNAIREWHPDAIIYIDFPGFNMRMARWSRKNGFANFYYIAPQAWAWKESRALTLKRDVDEMFCILPFEKEFFARFNFQVHYVGHPLVDIIKKYRDNHSSAGVIREGSGHRRIIALLPGSRVQEVKKILPVQLNALSQEYDFDIIIGKSPHVDQRIYDKICSLSNCNSIYFEDNTYALLDKAYVAAVASGTATLETALFKVPELVCFRGSKISYQIARRLIKVPYISLVNLILGKELVSELIQENLTPDNIRKEVKKLTEPSKRRKLLEAYNQLETTLGIGGAAEKTAKIIISKIGD